MSTNNIFQAITDGLGTRIGAVREISPNVFQATAYRLRTPRVRGQRGRGMWESLGEFQVSLSDVECP